MSLPPDRELIARSFDHRASTYARSAWHQRAAERLVAMCYLRPGARVLDAATGTGFAALAAARAVGPRGHIVGIDLSRGMLREAAVAAAGAGLTQIEWREADATDLPREPDRAFDAVICAAGLLYMPVDEALREWARLLPPGGLVAFSGMQTDGAPAGRIFRECAAEFGIVLRDPSAPLGTPAACRAALRRAGFTPLAVLSETLVISTQDLAHAWEANLHAPNHAAIHTMLDEPQRTQLKRRYLDRLAALERDDADALQRARLLYATGRR